MRLSQSWFLRDKWFDYNTINYLSIVARIEELLFREQSV